MTERVLTIEEVAAEYPWGKSTLYRVCTEPDSPFWKRGGRWITTESDLLNWIRSGPKPTPRRSEVDPMPRRRTSSVDSFLAEVHDLPRRAA